MFFDILESHSPLAQLVEHLPYMEGVVGSSPTGTTTISGKEIVL